MSNNQLSAILVLLIPHIIHEIVENQKETESNAITAFYNSKLYALLEKDETKLWHLSPKALYSLYFQEMKTGKIDFPEEC